MSIASWRDRAVQDNAKLLDRATEDPRKRAYFREEVYFREAIDDWSMAWSERSEAQLSRSATLILKPEAVAGRMLELALELIARHGFRVVGSEMLTIHRLMTRELWRYRFNIATNERLLVMDLLMAASPSLFVLLEHPSPEPGGLRATALLKAIKGPSDPRRREPHQLRYQLGCRSHLINYVHAPDEPADLIRELAILFERAARQSLLALAASGEDRMAVALEQARALYQAHEQHDLSYEASLARLSALCLHPPAPETAEVDRSADVEGLLSKLARKESRDWRALFAALQRRPVSVPLWDRILVLAELIDLSLPEMEPLL